MNFVHLELLVTFGNKKNLVKEIPEKPFKVSLRSNSSCHTLSKAFVISRKTPPQFKSFIKLFTYFVIVIDWLTQESPGLNPDCLREIKLLSVKKVKSLL